MNDLDPKRELPPFPNADHLRNQAKARLAAMRVTVPGAKLGHAQIVLAREYGFANWQTLQAHVKSSLAPRGLEPARRSGRRPRPRFEGQPDLERDIDIDMESQAALFRAAAIMPIGFLLTIIAGVALVCHMAPQMQF